MNSDDPMPSPKSLKTLACHVKFPEGNILLHQFVLDNSDPNHTCSASYMNAVLLSMSGAVSGNELNHNGLSALHMAVLKDNILMVKKLLSCLVDINVNEKSSVDKNQNTALHLASKMGLLSIAQELVSKGALINIKNSKGKAPLLLAVESGHLDLIKFLAMNGADLNLHPLRKALGNIEVMKCLLSCGVCVNAAYMWGNTVLHYAVREGNLDLIEFLIANRADVNARSELGMTPFHLAAQSGNLKVMKCLLSHGADINAANSFELTALHCAAYSGNRDAVELLCEEDSNVVRIYNIMRAFETAALSGNIDMLKFLEGRGAELNVEGYYGYLLLCHSIQSDNLELLSYLIDKGADINTKDEYGYTPLHWSFMSDEEKILNLLKEKGVII